MHPRPPPAFFQGAVLRMSLDEDQSGMAPQGRKAADDVFNIARLVPAGTDDRGRRRFLDGAQPEGAGDGPFRQAHPAEAGEIGQVPVQEGGDAGDGERHQQMRPAGDHFEFGQVQQIGDVLGTGPVVDGNRRLEVKGLGEIENGLPEPAVPLDDDAGSGVADGSELLEDSEQIVEATDDVGEDDDVERLSGQGQFLHRRGQERQVRMALLCQADHLPGDVDAYAFRRAERGQEIAGAASDLEDPLAGGDIVLRDGFQALVVAPIAALPVENLRSIAVEDGFDGRKVGPKRLRRDPITGDQTSRRPLHHGFFGRLRNYSTKNSKGPGEAENRTSEAAGGVESSDRSGAAARKPMNEIDDPAEWDRLRKLIRGKPALRRLYEEVYSRYAGCVS